MVSMSSAAEATRIHTNWPDCRNRNQVVTLLSFFLNFPYLTLDLPLVLGRFHTCSISYPENESTNTCLYCIECKLRCAKIIINISFNSQGFCSCWCYYSFSGNSFHSSKYIPQTPSLFTKLNFHESVWLRSRQNRRSQVISKNQEMCGGWEQGLRCLAVEIKVQIDSPSWSLSVIDLFVWALLMLYIQTNRVWINCSPSKWALQ